MTLAEHDQPATQFNAPSTPQMGSPLSPSAFPSAATDWRVLILALAALAFAARGQYVFLHQPDYMWDGVVFYAVAVACFVAAWRRLQPLPDDASTPALSQVLTESSRATVQVLPEGLAGIRGRMRGLMALVAVGCSLLAAVLANRAPDAESYWGPFWLWLIGWVGFLGVFAIGNPLPGRAELARRWRAWLAAHALELLALGSVLFIAFLVRLIALETIPINLGGDEGTQGVWALDALTGKLRNMFTTGWYNMPTLQFFIVAAFLRFFPVGSVAALRLPFALAGLLSVLWTYLLVRDLWGSRRLALLSAFILATFSYHIHFSRLGSSQIIDAFFVTLVLWLYVRAERSGHFLTYALCGVALGFSLYFYYGARIIGIILAVFILYRAVGGLAAWQNRRRAGAWDWQPLVRSALGLTVLLVAGLLVLAPLIGHYIRAPETFTSRIQAVSILSPGYLDREAAYWKTTKVHIIGEQLRKSLTGFHFTPDPTFWYRPGRPLLDAVSAVLMVFGVAYGIMAWRRWEYGLVVTWLFLAVMFGWVLTENPPSSMRMLVATPAVAILVAVGLEQLVQLGRKMAGRVAWIALPLVAGIIAILNLNFYFREYTPTTEYGYISSQVATPLARYLQQRGGTYQVYLLSNGEVLSDNGVLRYMLYGAPVVDVLEPLSGPPTFVDASREAVFVFLPSRRGELQWVRQAYPQGRVREFAGLDGRPLFTLYDVGIP
jgi:4-amino-4-deoxy-L-arabinose transferase-like glycosyltransferase